MSFPGFTAWFDLTRARTAIALLLLVSAPTLLALACLIGPFQTYDEAAHFYRSVQLSEGRVMPRVSPGHDAAGDNLDAALQRLGGYYYERSYTRWTSSFGADRQDFADAWAEPLAGRDEFTKFSNTAIYFPFAHLAPAAAIAVLRRFGAPPLAWMYGGRLTNAVLAMLGYCLAIAVYPPMAMFVFVIALLPRTLFATASMSPDALLVAVSVLFGALVGRLAHAWRMTGGHYALLMGATMFIGLNKIAYIPMAAIPFVAELATRRRFSRAAAALGGTAVLTVVVWAGWMVLIKDAVFPIRHDVPIDVYGQLRGLLQDPVRAAGLMKNTFATSGLGYVNAMVGGDLGSSETSVPKFVAGLTWAFLVAAALLGPVRLAARWVPLGATAFIALGVSLSIFLLLYMQYTALGARVIDGVQGRYFLPLLAVLAALLPRFRMQTAQIRLFSAAAFLWLSLTSAETVWSVYKRYWTDPTPPAVSFRDFRHTNLE